MRLRHTSVQSQPLSTDLNFFLFLQMAPKRLDPKSRHKFYHDRQPLQCPHCSREFRNLSGLTQHRNVHHRRGHTPTQHPSAPHTESLNPTGTTTLDSTGSATGDSVDNTVPSSSGIFEHPHLNGMLCVRYST